MLKFHDKRCQNCRYYRVYQKHSDCLNLGRTLSSSAVPYADMARYCNFWKRRPKNWLVNAERNPFWYDLYIPRETQLNLPGRKKS